MFLKCLNHFCRTYVYVRVAGHPLFAEHLQHGMVVPMELTADLANKEREMMLCHKQLLCLRKFSNPLNAWVERSRTKRFSEKMERLIQDLNPRRKDLNRFDIDSLSCYNSLGEEIERILE